MEIFGVSTSRPRSRYIFFLLLCERVEIFGVSTSRPPQIYVYTMAVAAKKLLCLTFLTMVHQALSEGTCVNNVARIGLDCSVAAAPTKACCKSTRSLRQRGGAGERKLKRRMIY